MRKRCQCCLKKNPKDTKYCLDCGAELDDPYYANFYDAKRVRFFKILLAVFISCCFIFYSYSSYISWRDEQIRNEELRFVGIWLEQESDGNLYRPLTWIWTFYDNKTVKITKYHIYDFTPEIDFKYLSNEKIFEVSDIDIHDEFKEILWFEYTIENKMLVRKHDDGTLGYNDYKFTDDDSVLQLDSDLTLVKISNDDILFDNFEWADIEIHLKEYLSDGSIKNVDNDNFELIKSNKIYSYDDFSSCGEIEKNDQIKIKYNDYRILCFEIFWRKTNSKILNQLYFNGDFLFVDENGTKNYSKIQDAIDASKGNEIVFVYEGYYYENIVLKDKVVLIGEDPENTIINGGDLNTTVKIFDTGSDTAITGFTITNGNSSDYGGGILMDNSDARVSNNILIDNHAVFGGAGISIKSGCDSAIISNNIIKENGGRNYREFSRYISIQPGNGGGICCYSTNTLICNNIIRSNTALRGGGIYLGGWYDSPLVVNNVIYDNNAEGRGGGIFTDSNCIANISNNIISNNEGCGIYVDFLSYPKCYNNCFWQNSNGKYGSLNEYSFYRGTNDISKNPKFVRTFSDDFSLQSNSPCIDAGNNLYAPDFDFNNNPRPVDGNNDGIKKSDIGAFESQG